MENLSVFHSALFNCVLCALVKRCKNLLIILTIFAVFGMIKVLTKRRNAVGVGPLLFPWFSDGAIRAKEWSFSFLQSRGLPEIEQG